MSVFFFYRHAACRIWLCLCLISCFFLTGSLLATDTGAIQGTVQDPLGAFVANAKVELLDDGTVVTSTTTDSEGQFRLPVTREGHYVVRVTTSSFRANLTDVPFASASGETRVNVLLSIEALPQRITVTDVGLPVPQSRTGASVSLLTPDLYPNTQDVQEALRFAPGLQLTQSGQRGSASSLFIRGGNATYNKVLVDGIPVGDVGGTVNFGIFATAGNDQVEVLRAPNSALYGADALAGVVNLTTAHGATPLPLVTYRVGGGNFGTLEQEVSLGGVYKRLDYFTDFLRFDTANSVPNSQFHNGSFAGNVGLKISAGTDLRAVVHRIAVADGNPSSLDLLGIPDDSVQRNQYTLIAATLDNQTTDRWHNLVRYSGMRLRGQFINYSATGIPFDGPFGTEYLGKPVTIRGANGYTVSGQAQFDFAQTYPNVFRSSTDRDILYAQSDYRINAHTLALGAFKYERERGYTLPTDFAKSSVNRTNYSYTAEINGDLHNRLFYTIGTGVENNAVLGVEATPRAALAYYLFRPGASSLFSGTKLHFSYSSGIKEPTITSESESLFALLSGSLEGQQLISQYHIGPIGAERSRTFDGGIDQQLFGGKARTGITYFHNRFSDGIEFVPQQGLLALGVPKAITDAAQFGATVNSQVLRAQGVEFEYEQKLSSNIFVRGGYTYLDAVVQRSLSSDTLFPSFNPSFPSIPIGAFSPLKGARPFRRAPHSGYVGVYYNRSRWLLACTGTFVGKRDDSDFLFDKDFGTSLLLPNRNLDAAYQRVDVSGSFRVNRTLSFYSGFQNVLSQHYSEAFGFPTLPFTFRSGIKITLGGESWRLK